MTDYVHLPELAESCIAVGSSVLGAGRWAYTKVIKRISNLELAVASCESDKLVKVNIIEMMLGEMAKNHPESPIISRAVRMLLEHKLEIVGENNS